MSVSQEFGSSPFRPVLVAERARFGGHVDAVVGRSDSHYIALWFAPAGPAGWEVVGVDLVPADPLVEGLPDQADWIDSWLRPRGEMIAAAVSRGARTPLGQPDVRGIPLRAAASWRSSRLLMNAYDSAPELDVEVRAGARGLSDKQLRLAGLLQDAMDYTHARAYGVSPAALIALRRGVTSGTAEQRIAKARLAGLLADDSSGGLTAAAERLEQEIARGIHRIIGKA